MKAINIGKGLSVELLGREGSHHIWRVNSVVGEFPERVRGWIEWDAKERQYTHRSHGTSVMFSAQDLYDLAAFLVKENAKQPKQPKRRKS